MSEFGTAIGGAISQAMAPDVPTLGGMLNRTIGQLDPTMAGGRNFMKNFQQFSGKWMPRFERQQAQSFNRLEAKNRGRDPGLYNTRDQLASQIQSGIGTGLRPEELDFFRQQMMAGQANRGLIDSPLGAQAEARGLMDLELAQRQQNLMNAQNFINSYRPTYTGTPGGFQGSMFQMPGFGDMFSAQGNLEMADYGQELNYANTIGGGIGAGFGQILGAGAMAMGMPMLSGMGGGGKSAAASPAPSIPTFTSPQPYSTNLSLGGYY